ncbi:TonB family protein [Brevundimonas sp.]|uniref:TonB family protein n=1 Tax=Brevundimonas sp. TaxID=1871086 RepID=UPI003F719DD0
MVILAAVAFQDATAPSPATTESVSPVLPAPVWVRPPQVNTSRLPRQVHGRVVLRCKTTLDGRLEGCEVLSDSSQSGQLGPHALAAAGEARIKPLLTDGQESEGQIAFTVRVVPDP